MKTRFTLIGLLLAAGALHAQTWNGATSDDWFTGSNWSTASVPGSSSSVTIPGSLSRYPKLSGNVSIAALTMQSGSSLNLNGNTLASAGNLSIVSAAISGGGSFTSTGAGSVTVQGATITAAVSITGYTGAAHIYDNSITGNTTISNASSQSGDNYIDGNTFTGNLTLTHNSGNSSLSEGYASPSSQANVITGNAIFNQAASTAFYSSYSRPTQFGGNLTISHTGSGLLSMFRNSASVGGDLSLTSSSGAGRDELNYSPAATVNVAGKVNLSIASGASFEMNKIKGATSGGSVSVTSPTTVEMSSDTLKSNVSIATYTGFAHIYDNDITGNVLFSNTAGQSGDNNIDGNNISGTFSLTQASNNNVMDEGYSSPTAHANKIGGNTTMSLTGVRALNSSYSRPTQFGGNLTITHTGSGLLSMFISSGSVGGDLSLTSSGSAGKDELNPSSAATVNVSGKVNISVVTGAPFEMNKIRNATAGGSVTVSGPTSIQITSDTLKSNLSVTSYTGSAHVYDNDITGDVVLSNTAGQSGDNYIDGNNISGTLSLTQASNNNEMDEGYGSPSGNANKIGGNTAISLTGVRTLYTSYSRPSQFGGNLTVSHTGSGMLSAFVNSASVSGNLSVTSGSGAGRVELNPTPSATVNVGGKVDVSINSGASFEMNRIKGATSGGTVSVTGPTSVEFAYDTLKSDVSITNYTGFAHVYDNNITGNMALSNTAGQSGDNYVDGSNISGTFSLTQASNNSDMDEGFGSPSGNANKIGGNTTMSLTGVKALYTSYSRPSQFGGNLTVSHTGSGLLSMFLNSGSVGGNFSLTSTAGAGGDQLNPSDVAKVVVAGKVDASVASGGSFEMNGITGLTSGGALGIASPGYVNFRHDTLKSDVSLTNYLGQIFFFDNNIAGNVVLSNTSAQSGANYIDGNQIDGNFSLTHASNNSAMSEGYGSPSGNGNHVTGNTAFYHTGVTAFISDYSHNGAYDGNFAVQHDGSGDMTLFATTGSVGGNFTLVGTAGAGANSLNPSGSDVVDIGGKVRIMTSAPKNFTMNYLRSSVGGDTIAISGGSLLSISNDTLSAVMRLTGFTSSMTLYNNRITGPTLVADAASQSGSYYLDGNHFNGDFSLVHATTNAVYEGYAATLGDVVSGVDSLVNLSAAGALNIGYSHSHHAAGTFIMNAGSGINFGSNAFIFDGPSTGAVRNYGAQQIVIPNVTLAKTGGAMVNLQAPVSISNSMNFTSGYMAGSSGSPLVFTSGAGYSNASDASHALGTVIKVGSSAFTFPTGDGTHYFPCGISAPASATDSFFAEYKNQSPSSAGYTPSQKDASINHVSNAQYWLISRAASTSSNVKVTLGFNSTSGVNNLSDLVVAHWYDPGTGAKWVNEGNGGTTGTTSLGTITSNNTITTFSPFTLGSTTSNNPLPITLTAFTATAVGQTALLNWHSGVEINVLRFDVQRSSDGQAFATLGSVAPQGSGHAYDFTDPAPAEGLNLYRLAIAEADGNISYSTVQALRFGVQGGIPEIVLYPNPASESLFVDGLAAYAGAVLSIRNITGQLLHQQLMSGQSRVEISLRDLPAGAYLLNVDDANGSVYRGRFLRR